MSLNPKQLELMLLGWHEHHRTGFKVTFLVPPEDEDYFKSATTANGKIAGQRYAVVMVELGPDELPVQAKPERKTVLTPAETKAQATLPIDSKQEFIAKVTSLPNVDHHIVGKAADEIAKPRFPDGLCGLAVRWCADAHFQDWMGLTFPEQYFVGGEEDMNDEECAKNVILLQCGVGSRKDLDTDKDAAERFKSLILEPYKKQRQEDEIDAEAPF